VANSSDWLGALAEAPVDGADGGGPDWLALLGAASGFRETRFGAPAPELVLAEPMPLPLPPEVEPDPEAEALARAYAEGVAAGKAVAAAEAEAHAACQRALRLTFRSLDEAALGVLADDLATTVMTLCDGALAGAALDREALIARCHAAARRIGGAADSLVLHLHPEDIALLGEEALEGWQVTPDATLERGSVLIAGPEGSVSDGPAEWRRAIAAGLQT
jgi:flagellar assembly protein FliH